jgi:gamma-glutamyl:cysteine ligase YbdK (ATP-grasp superfamily)
MAKKEWIEKTYNYSDNVEQMKTEIFKQIVETNTDVNSQVNTFTTKLSNVQKELQTIKARNYTA